MNLALLKEIIRKIEDNIDANKSNDVAVHFVLNKRYLDIKFINGAADIKTKEKAIIFEFEASSEEFNSNFDEHSRCCSKVH